MVEYYLIHLQQEILCDMYICYHSFSGRFIIIVDSGLILTFFSVLSFPHFVSSGSYLSSYVYQLLIRVFL